MTKLFITTPSITRKAAGERAKAAVEHDEAGVEVEGEADPAAEAEAAAGEGVITEAVAGVEGGGAGAGADTGTGETVTAVTAAGGGAGLGATTGGEVENIAPTEGEIDTDTVAVPSHQRMWCTGCTEE